MDHNSDDDVGNEERLEGATEVDAAEDLCYH
jgi:hypothetical protein